MSSTGSFYPLRMSSSSMKALPETMLRSQPSLPSCWSSTGVPDIEQSNAFARLVAEIEAGVAQAVVVNPAAGRILACRCARAFLSGAALTNIRSIAGQSHLSVSRASDRLDLPPGYYRWELDR